MIHLKVETLKKEDDEKDVKSRYRINVARTTAYIQCYIFVAYPIASLFGSRL
jgi:hypothetical protein